jgi:hypothetical protein
VWRKGGAWGVVALGVAGRAIIQDLGNVTVKAVDTRVLLLLRLPRHECDSE